MTKTSTEQLTDETMKTRIQARIGGAKDIATDITGAVTAGSKAYVGGVIELGQTLLGFGREMASEAGEHARATMQAKNLREAGELQAAYLQHRIEMTATHAKEFADLARARSEDAIAPIAALLKQDKAA